MGLSHSAGGSLTCSPPPLSSFIDAHIATVTVKLPPFWPNDLEMWFVQIDSHFSTKCITSRKTQFDNVVAPEYATEVRDIIIKPPSTDSYDTLRTRNSLTALLPHSKGVFNNYIVEKSSVIVPLHSSFLTCNNYWVTRLLQPSSLS
uniref:DUF7041 domain-containing protein n=1 Tax=Amphimedon queenslandica TaxID=400682 RepID=A0A1X7UT80_AMPQE